MLKLRGAFSQNPRLVPLLDGTVKPDGIEISFELGTPGAMFHRHLKDNEFDVFEFSISDYLIAREKQPSKWDWTAIPVFLSRAFLALNTRVNVSSGIGSFRDLRGKRYGMPDFTMTAALWLRAMVRELYGIRPQDVEWYNGRPLSISHGTQLGIDQEPPPELRIVWLQDTRALDRMLHAGEIDAAYGEGAEGVVPITEGSNVRRLFEEDHGRSFVEEFYRKTGFTPVNHTVALQRRLVEKDPWVAVALFEAFERSKQEAYRRARQAQAAYLLFPGDEFERQAAIYGSDPYPSGLGANRRMLAMAARESFDEGLTRKLANVDDLFWETVRGT